MALTVKRFVLLEAPVARVWEAWTEPRALVAWLAESAEGDVRPGGRLALDSRVPHVGGTHDVETLEPMRLLGLRWRVAGHPTRVGVRLEDLHGLTRVTVSHEVPDGFPAKDAITDTFGGEAEGLNYTWGYALLLLKSYVEEGQAQCRLAPDEDPQGVTWRMDLAAKPQDVFRALVEPAQVKEWNPYANDVVVEARQGGRYSFGWKSEDAGTDGPDEVVEYRDGHKITYSWHGKARKTLVSWEVEPLEGDARGHRTRLRLQHAGFVGDPKQVMEYKLGWAHFLYAIAQWTAKRQAMDVWNGRE